MADDVGYSPGTGATIRADDEGDGKLIQHMILHAANVALSSRATSIGTSAVAIPATALTKRKSITVYNNDSGLTLYLGASAVTTSTGLPVLPGAYVTLELGPTLTIYGIVASGSVDVRSLEKS